MTASPNSRRTAFSTIDLDKPGKQIGWIMLPHSTHDDAWGVTRIPIAVISNGKGPTVFSRVAITAMNMKNQSRFAISRVNLTPARCKDV